MGDWLKICPWVTSRVAKNYFRVIRVGKSPRVFTLSVVSFQFLSWEIRGASLGPYGMTEIVFQSPGSSRIRVAEGQQRGLPLKYMQFYTMQINP